VANRWKFSTANGIQGQWGIKGTYIQNNSGQLNGSNHEHPGTGVYNPWLANMDTRRMEGWYKMGYLFPEKPKTSIGLQLSALNHDQNGVFGKRKYDAFQQSFYANLLYQSIIGNTNHEFRGGLSYQYDRFDETLGESNFRRNESVPGAFSEYTYKYLNKFSLVAGLRADNHNQYGFFVTPRLHLRFSTNEKTAWRLVAGRGQRTPSVFAENIGALASSRVYQVINPKPNIPYGLNAEVAWNTGLSFSQEFQLYKKQATLNIELFHTRFVNQMVVDYDANPQRVLFYNLTGKSYATSFQSQLDIELLPRLDLRFAYRFNDVKTSYMSGLLQRPFVSKHKGFANFAYVTILGGWKFDATIQWQGQKRIPDLKKNPAAVFAISESPNFFIVNAQISKSVGKKLEMYLGLENLFNYKQDYPIISADDPNSEWFDGSMVWGPVFGRMAYTGLRFRINQPTKNP
jgi:outer membrane receptor for ferrienterochelin and colicin